MNKVFLIGNLTRDPELSTTGGGISICRFSIAVNRAYTNGDGERQTDFFNCTAWRGLAEAVARYTRKGNKVAVTGSVQVSNYEDNDGIKRIAVNIIAQDVEFLSQKSTKSDEDFYDDPHNGSSVPAKEKSQKRQMQIFDDDGDIPF